MHLHHPHVVVGIGFDTVVASGGKKNKKIPRTITCGGYLFQSVMGPKPMQLVVVMAVRKAVSAATITFTATSTIRFFMRHLPSG